MVAAFFWAYAFVAFTIAVGILDFIFTIVEWWWNKRK